ncbi:unnamed protein product [Paramecium octaurelia]|uniref:Uncharacterized protein n=1 Tax=Paramecium octaurelia TaxID=43137 RepID=A0A8S1SPW5_PAROT|nr:unnamed protein product [Paramecium octaurelia]
MLMFSELIKQSPANCLLCYESDSRYDCLKWTLYISTQTETNSQYFNQQGWDVQNGQSQKSPECQRLPMPCETGLCGINTPTSVQIKNKNSILLY